MLWRYRPPRQVPAWDPRKHGIGETWVLIRLDVAVYSLRIAEVADLVLQLSVR